MKICFLFVICFLGCCKSADPLILERNNLTDELLNLNGYFYLKDEISGKYNVFFIYRNGVFYYTNTIVVDLKNLVELDNHINRNHSFETAKLHWYWGVVNVKDKVLKINKWLTGTGGSYPTQLLIGEILDANTIKISGLRGNENLKKVDYWHFREFSPKPDSTNRFIK